MTFEEAMILVRTRGSELLLSDIEAQAMYNVLTQHPLGSRVVEIGCHWGRSSALIAQVAKTRLFKLLFIDPFTGEPDIAASWMRMMTNLDVPFTLACTRSELVQANNIDLLYLDGDHNESQVKIDCKTFLPHLEKGGYLLAHDYRRNSLPGITKALDASIGSLDFIGVFDSLGIWRKSN